MKKLYLFLLAWLLLAPAFASDNLLFNPGFEGGVYNSVPWSWLRSANGENKVELTSDSHRSENAVMLTKKRGQENNYLGLGQNVFVEGGATYRLSVWAKGKIDGIEPGLFAWRYNDTTATSKYFLGNSEYLKLKLTDNYQHYYIDLVMPMEAVMLQIRCEIYSPDSEGVFWLDDFDFRKLKEPPPRAPEKITYQIKSNKLALSWEPPSGTFAGTYNVYRSHFNGFTPTQATLIASAIKEATFIDGEINYPTQESLFYLIQAVNVHGRSQPAQLMVPGKEKQALGHNLIQNGDFELDSNEDKKPDGYAGFDLEYVKLDDNSYSSPNHSALLSKDKQITWVSVRPQSKIFVEQGVRYRLSAKVKSDAQVGNFRLYAYQHDFEGKYFGNTPIFQVPQNTDGWITAAVEFESPANCQFIYVVYEMFGKDLVGKSWLDDLLLVPIRGGNKK